MATPQVFVVDDDSMVRKAVGRVLSSAGHHVRLFGSAQEFLSHGPGAGPACALLDLRLPDLNGLELHRRLRESAPSTQVIFLSGFGDIPTTVKAMKAGAFDFLTKPVTDARLLASVEAALVEASRRYGEAEQRRSILSRYESLTRREREVLQLVVAGCLNKHIARELDISEKTVKVHRARVMQKMGARRVAELVRLTLPLGFRTQQSGIPRSQRQVGA